jgi:hypothetical protein
MNSELGGGGGGTEDNSRRVMGTTTIINTDEFKMIWKVLSSTSLRYWPPYQWKAPFDLRTWFNRH